MQQLWEDEHQTISTQISGKENMRQYEQELADIRVRLRDIHAKKDRLNRDDGALKSDIDRCKKLYDSLTAAKKDNIGEELDFMLLDIDDEDDNPFSEEIELDDETLDEDDLLGKNTEETIKDEYEFNDVDPEIFRDPTRMVKWLKKNE